MHHELKSLPRFSIRMDDAYCTDASGTSAGSAGMSSADHIRELSPVEEADRGAGELSATTALPSQSAGSSSDPSDPVVVSTGTRPKIPVPV